MVADGGVHDEHEPIAPISEQPTRMQPILSTLSQIEQDMRDVLLCVLALSCVCVRTLCVVFLHVFAVWALFSYESSQRQQIRQ